jgi:leucine dehydrogenase
VHRVHGGSGDPSPFTAFGTLQGIKACLLKKYGHDDPGKVSFAVQGVGSVGSYLTKFLSEAGAKVFVCDISPDRVQQCVDDYGAEAVPMDAIYDVDANVFSPCALGGVINEETLSRLKFDIVAGSANNQLETSAHGTALEERGILYAPDYAINAGGLMNVAIELQGYDRDRAYRTVSSIRDIMGRIFQVADRDGIPTWKAADRLAEERIAMLTKVKEPYSKRFKDRLSGRRTHATAADE